ncbi:actin-interacting protein [Pseudovirgaria hyperparasitica]|uniref:Actin-interacting protein n=1 Tax=Pseudovirgaria hyperparasitica TaxID=470096 RepID=A0A6A6WC48_9PEZI|nr:actin-interacting protein [Pseudovirgaria hyperparasitica]KAF2759614.1 actin-interacting protein [Pseudovirgaria hyperparasitica]
MATHTDDIAQQRSSAGSARGGRDRRPQTVQQQLSKIEKSVTHLLVATKQLLETLTQWSRNNATEGEVSDVYVRLGYEFNIASRAFNEIGVETTDLGNVPESLRGILEETLSQEASQASLDRYLPKIRDIIINLLHGLKKKQQRLRQRKGIDGTNGTARQGSVSSTGGTLDLDEEIPQRSSSNRPSAYRQGSGDMGFTSSVDPPPRTTSAPGRSSPNKYESVPPNSRTKTASRDTVASNDSSLSSNTMQNIPVISPYPTEEQMPEPPKPTPPPYTDFPPPPPPPPKQQDALAALQRGGDLERRASRRFSAYQLQKLVGTNGIPMMPSSQNTPIPNRGRDARESMHAVRTRGSVMARRDKSTRMPQLETSSRVNDVSQQIKEEEPNGISHPVMEAPNELQPASSPIAKTPEDKLGPSMGNFEKESAELGATLSGPILEPVDLAMLPEKKPSIQRRSQLPSMFNSRKKSPSPPHTTEFIPEGSPQPGKELTLFLQYKSRVKKFVFSDGADVSIPRLQLAFIEKFAWNTHNNGVDLPEIHIQDPVSGVRYELEDLSDIKDRAVLVLNVEVLDEVKKHIDDGLGGLTKLVEGIKATVDEQQAALQRVSARQVDTAKEIASIAAVPPGLTSGRGSMLTTPISPQPGAVVAELSIDAAAQLGEVASLRRDLAVVRQTYTSFVTDVESSMANVRAKAATVKSTAIKAAVPTLEGDTGRSYVNAGKKTLSDDSEKIVNRVDDLQDLVEDLRKDVVSRGVRPKPRQLEIVAKDIQIATSEVKKLQDYLRKEKPIWTKIWERELQVVCDERELLSMQEDLAADLQDDLDKAAETFQLVEEATKQQNLPGANRSASGTTRGNANRLALTMDQAVDPRKAKDNFLGEVRALQPNHEGRLEAIHRAERVRQKELESRRGGEFGRELASFVDEGKLKKSGGVEEVERLRKLRDEQNIKANLEAAQQRAAAVAERQRERAAAAAAATTDDAVEKQDVTTPEAEFADANEDSKESGGEITS